MRFLALVVLAFGCDAGEWPRFRGPDGAGVSQAKNLPVEFGPSKNLAWKIAVPPGHSSPILSGGRILLTGWQDDRLLTIALDPADGKIAWQRELPRERKQAHHHDNNNPAPSSVAADGKAAYVFFADFGLAAYRISDGKEIWRLPLGPFHNYHGMGASPVLAGDTLIMLLEQDRPGQLFAVDAATGKEKWRKARPPGNGYATPVAWKDVSGWQVAAFGPGKVTGYSVATGEEVWWLDNLAPQPKSSPYIAKGPDGSPLLIVSAQTAGDEGERRPFTFAGFLEMFDKNKTGRLIIAEAIKVSPGLIEPFTQMDANADGEISEAEFNNYVQRVQSPNTMVAVRLGGKGDLAKDVLWRREKFVPNVPMSVAYGGVLYVLKEGGIFLSIDPASGEVFKQGRLTGALDQYFASLVAADGKIYATSQAGHVSVIKAGREWELLRVNDLDEPCMATPALDDGRVFVRTKTALYAFKAE